MFPLGQGACDIIFLDPAYEVGWPVLSIVSSFRSAVFVLTIAEFARDMSAAEFLEQI